MLIKGIAAALIILLVFIAIVSGLYYFFLMPNNNFVAAFEEGSIHIVVGGEQVKSRHDPIIDGREILLPIDIIIEYLDPDIYWDEELKKVTITTDDRVVRLETESLEAFVNNKPVTLNIPAVEEDGTVFVPIVFLSELYNIDITYLEDDNVIIIDHKNRMIQTARTISKDAVIRSGPSIRYPVLKRIDPDSGKGLNLRVFEEYDKWYKVRTEEGIIGFIEKRFVAVKWVTDITVPYDNKERGTPWKPDKGKINLVWEMMYSGRPKLSSIGSMEGLDVVSPTWFQIINDKGDILNRSDAGYVDWAHSRGYKVWALLANDFGDPSMTHKVLNNTDVRDNIIRQMLTYASLYNLDGINIDFENINIEDRDALTQFVREITPFFREQGLVVSIDVGVPDGSENYSRCYDIEALGKIVDYMMLMAYDQHWSTSPVAGSVAQLSWVERKLKRTLEMIRPDKLILGIPFYIRLWEEKLDESGKIKVSNPKALTMEEAHNLIQENDADVKWDEESGQFYAEYTSNGALYKIWLEDENSINLKSSLVHKYGLAGTAAWRRGSEVQEVWQVLNENLKNVNSYLQWKQRNSGSEYTYNISTG